MPPHWFTASPLFLPYKITTAAVQQTKMKARGEDDVETTRIIVRFVSIRNSCGIFHCFSNYRSFYSEAVIVQKIAELFTFVIKA